MSEAALSFEQIRAALQRLGSLLPLTPQVEMVLIGGAAGVLSGALPSTRTTIDCDVLIVSPPESFDLCQYYAEEVAEHFEIGSRWLDSSAHSLTHLMLPGWRDRLITVETFGSLQVRAVGRLDLIALKVIAGRPEDLEDLVSLSVQPKDVEQILKLIPAIHGRGISPDSFAAAIETLRTFGGDDGF